MRTTLGIVDGIAEAEDILMELIHILKGDLDLNPFGFTGKIDDIADGLLEIVHITDEPHESVGFMKGLGIGRLSAKILEDDGQIRIEIGRLMQAALDLVLLEPGAVKNRGIREKIDRRAMIARLAEAGKQSVFELGRGFSSLVSVAIDESAGLDRYGQSLGKGVYYGRSDAMEAAAGLVGGIVEFAAGMEGRKDETFRAHALLMHSDRDTSAVVGHGCGAILLQGHGDAVTETGEVLIHGVVNDLIDEVVEAFGGDGADIHAGTDPDRFQPFQNGDAGSVIIGFGSHESTSF